MSLAEFDQVLIGTARGGDLSVSFTPLGPGHSNTEAYRYEPGNQQHSFQDIFDAARDAMGEGAHPALISGQDILVRFDKS